MIVGLVFPFEVMTLIIHICLPMGFSKLLQTEETKGWLTALDVDRKITHVGGD